MKLKDLMLRVRAELREAARQGRSVARPLKRSVSDRDARTIFGVVRPYVLTEQWLATLAVEAVATELRVVRRYAVTDLEFLDILHPYSKYMLCFPVPSFW